MDYKEVNIKSKIVTHINETIIRGYYLLISLVMLFNIFFLYRYEIITIVIEYYVPIGDMYSVDMIYLSPNEYLIILLKSIMSMVLIIFIPLFIVQLYSYRQYGSSSKILLREVISLLVSLLFYVISIVIIFSIYKSLYASFFVMSVHSPFSMYPVEFKLSVVTLLEYHSSNMFIKAMLPLLVCIVFANTHTNRLLKCILTRNKMKLAVLVVIGFLTMFPAAEPETFIIVILFMLVLMEITHLLLTYKKSGL